MTTKSADQTIYFKGNKARLTGKTETVYGGIFHEAIYIEGSEKGQTIEISDRLVKQAAL